MRVPFVIYADFQLFNVKLDTCENDPEKSYPQELQKQILSSFVFYLVSTTNERFELVTYTPNADVDIASISVNKLFEYSNLIYEKHEMNLKGVIFTDHHHIKTEYDNAKVCHKCEHNSILREMIENEDIYEALKDQHKVRDHCHITGKYCGAAHTSCNLNYQVPEFYPVVMNNLAGHDAHLFIKKRCCNINCIPNR